MFAMLLLVVLVVGVRYREQIHAHSLVTRCVRGVCIALLSSD